MLVRPIRSPGHDHFHYLVIMFSAVGLNRWKCFERVVLAVQYVPTYVGFIMANTISILKWGKGGWGCNKIFVLVLWSHLQERCHMNLKCIFVFLFYSDSEDCIEEMSTTWLPKMHTLIIGPGLGSDELLHRHVQVREKTETKKQVCFQ